MSLKVSKSNPFLFPIVFELFISLALMACNLLFLIPFQVDYKFVFSNWGLFNIPNPFKSPWKIFIFSISPILFATSTMVITIIIVFLFQSNFSFNFKKLISSNFPSKKESKKINIYTPTNFLTFPNKKTLSNLNNNSYYPGTLIIVSMFSVLSSILLVVNISLLIANCLNVAFPTAAPNFFLSQDPNFFLKTDTDTFTTPQTLKNSWPGKESSLKVRRAVSTKTSICTSVLICFLLVLTSLRKLEKWVGFLKMNQDLLKSKEISIKGLQSIFEMGSGDSFFAALNLREGSTLGMKRMGWVFDRSLRSSDPNPNSKDGKEEDGSNTLGNLERDKISKGNGVEYVRYASVALIRPGLVMGLTSIWFQILCLENSLFECSLEGQVMGCLIGLLSSLLLIPVLNVYRTLQILVWETEEK